MDFTAEKTQVKTGLVNWKRKDEYKISKQKLKGKKEKI